MIVYALESLRSFSTVLGQLDHAESKKIGGKIWNVGEHAVNRDLNHARDREIRELVSRLLKVVET